jgi:phospholipid-translocating ATPase
VYSDNLSPYDVKGGFTKSFGRDPNWWLVLILTLAILITIELALKSARRSLALSGRWPLWKRKQNDGTKNAEELDLEIWQEMEQDPGIRERLRALATNSGEERA